MQRFTVFTLFLMIGLAASQHIITCYVCQASLKQMVNQMNAKPEVLQALGDNFSNGCNEIPEKKQRVACRQLFNQHFNEVFQEFSTGPDTDPAAMCKNMNFC